MRIVFVKGHERLQSSRVSFHGFLFLTLEVDGHPRDPVQPLVTSLMGSTLSLLPFLCLSLEKPRSKETLNILEPFKPPGHSFPPLLLLF